MQVWIKVKSESSHDSLVYDFKGVSPSMHVDQVKSLIGFNSTIPCKTKPNHEKKTCRFGSFELVPFYLFLPIEMYSVKLIHLNGVIDWFSSLIVFASMSSDPEFQNLVCFTNGQQDGTELTVVFAIWNMVTNDRYNP